MLDINKFLELIILDRNPNTNILSNSSNDLIFKFTNISLALLRQGNPIKRRKLLLFATLNFFRAVLVQSNHMGAQYKLEQYVLNK